MHFGQTMHMPQAGKWYLIVAVLLHVGALGLLSRLDMKQSAQAVERELARSETLTQGARTQQRVRDLEKIKALLGESNGDQRQASAKPPGPEPEQAPEFSATSLPERPGELIERARGLSKEIDKIDKDLQAKALAEVLKVSKEEALKQIAAGTKAAVPPDAAGRPAEAAKPAEAGKLGEIAKSVDAAKPSESAKPGEAQAAAEIQKLETQAMAVLKRRQQQLMQQANGVSVKGDPSVTSELGQRIGNFINRDVAPITYAHSRYTNQGIGEWAYGGGSIPAVDVNGTLKGTGRTLGAGGAMTNRLYLNSWYVIGPFEGKHGRALFKNYRYPPEDGVILDASYRGKEGRLLRWQYVSAQTYPLIPPDEAENAVYYGYTELMSDEAVDVIAWIGADDDGQVWLNDRQIWAGGYSDKGWFWEQIYNTKNSYVRDFNLTEGKRVIHLRKGRNKLFFKLSNGPSRLFFSMVLEPMK